ncbi:Hypothetical protein CINCED_3A022135 [Cinara cedri]|nr:Hypothetical protein CINCED_3A022135 [Cinara cedri]
MQYFIIGYIITACSVSYFYLAAAIWSFLVISSIIINFYLVYALNFSIINSFLIPLSIKDVLYKLPWTRIGPYLVGMAVAYFLLQTKRKIHLNKIILWIFWILTTFPIILIIWYSLVESSVLETACLWSLIRVITIAFSIGWIVWASVTGYGGFINTFLSHEIFVVVDRLTYCAYLINPIIIFLSYFDADKAIHNDMIFQLPTFLGVVILTFFGAFILYLMFEKPFRSLLELLTTK